MKRLSIPALTALALFVACASDRPGRTRLEDGSYRLTCKEPLARCLALLTDVCSRYGYDVLHAKEAKRHYGPSVWEEEYVSSEALVRCREPEALIGGRSEPATLPSGTHPAARSAPPGRCFPGSTQACLGPGACQGAQTCRADGAMFGACDCGQAASESKPPEATDAGPAPTWALPSEDGGAVR